MSLLNDVKQNLESQIKKHGHVCGYESVDDYINSLLNIELLELISDYLNNFVQESSCD